VFTLFIHTVESYIFVAMSVLSLQKMTLPRRHSFVDFFMNHFYPELRLYILIDRQLTKSRKLVPDKFNDFTAVNYGAN